MIKPLFLTALFAALLLGGVQSAQADDWKDRMEDYYDDQEDRIEDYYERLEDQLEDEYEAREEWLENNYKNARRRNPGARFGARDQYRAERRALKREYETRRDALKREGEMREEEIERLKDRAEDGRLPPPAYRRGAPRPYAPTRPDSRYDRGRAAPLPPLEGPRREGPRFDGPRYQQPHAPDWREHRSHYPPPRPGYDRPRRHDRDGRVDVYLDLGRHNRWARLLGRVLNEID